MCQRKQFYIRVNGKPVEVNEDVYLCYYRAKQRMRYYERDIKTARPIHVDSIERQLQIWEEYLLGGRYVADWVNILSAG